MAAVSLAQVEEWVRRVDEEQLPEVTLPEQIDSQWLAERCRRVIQDQDFEALVALAQVGATFWIRILDTFPGLLVMDIYLSSIISPVADARDREVDLLLGALRSLLEALREIIRVPPEAQGLVFESLVLPWLALLASFATVVENLEGNLTEAEKEGQQS